MSIRMGKNFFLAKELIYFSYFSSSE